MSQPRRLTDLAAVQLAPNPGPMTLDGTNSYVLRASRTGPVVIVDPGPEDPAHLAALADAGPVELILITHRHRDHTAGAAALHEQTGAPVRAPSAADCHGGDVLRGDERIEAAGLEITVMATPGHTADSVSFLLPGDGPHGSVLTGDTVLGRGTTVIGIPDGTLAQYLESLQRLASLGPVRGLPAHGPELPDLSDVCRRYLAHRERRLDQVRHALAELGTSAAEADVDALLPAIYGNVDPAVHFAARHSLAAQLAYLRDDIPVRP